MANQDAVFFDEIASAEDRNKLYKELVRDLQIEEIGDAHIIEEMQKELLDPLN